MKDKVILTDVDGVLFDWIYHFEKWLTNQKKIKIDDTHSGYTESYKIHERYNLPKDDGYALAREFNNSAEIGFLTPYRDAVKYVRKLYEEHGFIFHVITSQTDNKSAQTLRIENLKRVFGDVFSDFTILSTGSPKLTTLWKYKNTGCYWVEDKAVNIDDGISVGLRGLLMSETHNAGYSGEGIRVKNWKDIYNIIVDDKMYPITEPRFPMGVAV
jgi:FMN phosphatase YigB (HAD superfamily)